MMGAPQNDSASSLKTFSTEAVLSGQEQQCSVIDIASDQLVLNIGEASYVPSASVFEVVQYWPTVPASSELQELVSVAVDSKDDAGSEHRKRNQKRPFSPVVELKKKSGEKKKQKPSKRDVLKVNSDSPADDVDNFVDGPEFSCAKCQSPYVVNPSRRRGQAKKQKCIVPRRVFDPEVNKVLLLCNSCGIAMVRSKNKTSGKLSSTQEEKVEEGKAEYLRMAAQFASSLAKKLQDTDARQLYCPAFKLKPCGCIQDFINGVDENSEDAYQRAIYLLNMMKEAQQMASEKSTSTAVPEQANAKITRRKGPTSGSMKLRRSVKYENFVLTTRRYFKEQLKMCEKACQRVLHYSNNFLHKKLKTLPGKSSRMVKTLGRRRQGSLVPISQLASEHCCADKCVTIALTHSRLLETWRTNVELGQRAARRVLAEMLTPSGGAKSNCYKFISMVTGCSPTTICSVADQMRRTQGEREPLEHGLKKWWREHPKEVGQSSVPAEKNEDVDSEKMSALDIHIPTAEELRLLDPEEASRQLQEHRDKLAHLQKQLLGAHGSGLKHTLRQPGKKPPLALQAVGNNRTPEEHQQQVVHAKDVPHPDPAVLVPTSNVGINLPPQATSGGNMILVQESSEGIPVRYSADSKTGGPIELINVAVTPSLPSVVMVQSNINSSDGYQVFSVVESSGASMLQYS